MKLHYKEAEMKHGTSDRDANNPQAVDAIGGHPKEREYDTEFESQDGAYVTLSTIRDKRLFGLVHMLLTMVHQRIGAWWL